MKTVYLIGGTMGVGKTALCSTLMHRLTNSVFLDGDWCWNADPFVVTDETKAMVEDNICFLFNQFLRCSAYQNILFCWVMHQQSIIDSILKKLDRKNAEVKVISLTASAGVLKQRLLKDVQAGTREESIVAKSIERLPLYQKLSSIKINTDGKTIAEIAEEIEKL